MKSTWLAKLTIITVKNNKFKDELQTENNNSMTNNYLHDKGSQKWGGEHTQQISLQILQCHRQVDTRD